MREKLLNEWKKEFGDDFKLWSELGWWIEQLEQALKADRAQLVERARGMKKFTISKSYRCPKCNTYYGKEDEYCSRDRSKLVVTEYKHADEVQEPYNQALEDVLSILEEEV